MRRLVARGIAVTAVIGSALLAYAAVGNGDIVATPPVTVVTVTSSTGSGAGTATLQNTTASTAYTMLVDSDATCDPEVTFSVSGGNPVGVAATTSRTVTIGCPPRNDEAMKRCLFHATNNTNGTPLVDFMGVCLYGASPPTLTPLQTQIDFGAITVGNFGEQILTVRNEGTGAAIRRVYLMTSDLDGDFQFSAPCNPDGSYCDVDLTSAVVPGGTFELGVKCRPQTAGAHSAEVYVGTDTFQLLSLGVTLQCTGVATTSPALAMNPTTIEFTSPVEVGSGSASTTIHVANAGGGTLLVKDVRIIDVDIGAADDWSYTASGDCNGQITSVCMLEAGEQVALDISFDPSAIGSRRAALLVSYRDTLDRTSELPLDGVGLGATLRRLGPATTLGFGTVPVGRTSQLDVTLVNDGNRDTTATVTLAPSTTPPFSVMPAGPLTITPGIPVTLSVQCAPAMTGTFTTTISLATPESQAPLEIAATCDSTTGELYATPTSLQLGELRINTTAPTISVQLASNASELTLTGAPRLEAPNVDVTLGPLSQQTTPASFAVTIAPPTAGPLSATILVDTTAGQTLRIPVAATAVEASYITADALDLGTFCVDQPTTSSNVTLLSTSSATIEVSAPSLTAAISPFALVTTTPSVYPHQLAPARSAVVSVTPKRQRTAMPVDDTLTWTTDVAGAATAATSLTARYIDSGGAIAPPALNFGEEIVHLFTANGQRVVIQNCNATPLVLDPPNIRTPFSIDSPNFPAMLSPNESVAFSVGFHPTRVGVVMDTLRITSPQLPGAPLQVTLIGIGGTGSAMPPDAGVGSGGNGDTSFYSCSCSSSERPLGVMPIALAVAFVLIPRRRRTRLR